MAVTVMKPLKGLRDTFTSVRIAAFCFIDCIKLRVSEFIARIFTDILISQYPSKVILEVKQELLVGWGVGKRMSYHIKC